MELFHRILVTSAKGGIGKSTVALGVAAALSREGHRVLLLDCDAGNRCLDLMLGVENSVLYDLSDVYEGRCTPDAAFLSCPGLPNLVFCAAPVDPFTDLDADRFCGVLTSLAEASHAEFVICDTAGLGDGVRAIISGFADGALVIATQQPASIRSADRILVIQDGKVIEDGTHRQLIARQGYYYQLYTNQFQEEQGLDILDGKA